MIEAAHLSCSYQDMGDVDAPVALKDVSFSVEAGEYVAVLGHNGSGKSTLAKLLNLILLPSGGRLVIDGTCVTDGEPSEDDIFAIRRKVGMVFQNPDNQLVATLVEEDVAFGPENLGLPREEIRKRVDFALETVGMQAYANHSLHKLSGGQKQRVAIAGILAMLPNCIIFDEATAMLDPMGRREVMDTIERLNRERGMTVLHITHYMEEAARADRIIVINEGSVFMDGTPREIFREGERLRSVGLEVPQGVELVELLAKEGYTTATAPLTPEECVETILEILCKEGKI
jgi:energy-coupling factor transport system ATP-binding protein